MDRVGLREKLAELIVNLGGTPTDALLDLGLDLLVRDVEANKRYVVPGPLDIACGITAIGWDDDHEIPFSLMGGWRESTADCRMVQLEGGHFAFLTAPPALQAEIVRDLSDSSAHEW